MIFGHLNSARVKTMQILMLNEIEAFLRKNLHWKTLAVVKKLNTNFNAHTFIEILMYRKLLYCSVSSYKENMFLL